MKSLSKTSMFAVCVLLAACKSPGSSDTDGVTGDSSTGTSVTTVNPTTTIDPTTGVESSSSSGSSSSGSTSGTVVTGGETTTTIDPTTETSGGGGACVPLQCEGKFYACGDCMDNDGDGKVDQADPECISPCDDREDTFATGLPGDNMDPCKQDCFFDGNSGGGAGDCAWDLKCDPMNPGGDNCPYDPNFNNCPDTQSQECVETCEVPSGCDCFGCCTVSVDGMSYDIFLGDMDCSLNEIASCQMCTKNDDCDDACEPENCEVCFGETEPPPGCEDPSCEGDAEPCTIDDMGQSDCAEGYYCKTGCCHVLEPG